MNSSSIAEYIAELEKNNSRLIKENSELKEDQKRIIQLKKILGIQSAQHFQVSMESEAEPTAFSNENETVDIEFVNLFDEYVRRNGPAADLPEEEKFMSYHISDVLYWIAARQDNPDKRRLYDEVAASIYNLNHEIFTGGEALDVFNRSEILSENLSFSRSVAQKIDEFLKMPKTT
jgi:hypothetical protein